MNISFGDDKMKKKRKEYLFLLYFRQYFCLVPPNLKTEDRMDTGITNHEYANIIVAWDKFYKKEKKTKGN